MSDRDVIQIGNHRLEFRVPEAAARPGPLTDYTSTDVFEPGTAKAAVPAVSYALARERIVSVR